MANKERQRRRKLGKIAELFGESVFHNCGDLENVPLENDDIYVDLGNDAPEEISKE